jgi:hypothetical protein
LAGASSRDQPFPVHGSEIPAPAVQEHLIQLVAGFTPARIGGSEVMWRERAGAVQVVKKVDICVIFSDSL